MDYGALPPEINSGRMYLGPGPGTLLAASAGWESLAAELTDAAGGYRSVIASLTDEYWVGPTSMTMAAAAFPYMAWMTTTAVQCEQVATQATAAAGAFEAAYAMTVPPPLIVANRAQLMALIATNLLGQNTPAIMATEAEYSEMWAQDATAMYNYAASSASASTFSAFTSPPQTTNPGQAGAAAQAGGGQAGGTVQTTTSQLMSSVPQTLQTLSTPGAASGTGVSGAAEGTVASLGASGASTPLSALSSVTGASGKTVTKSASTSASALSSLGSVLSGAGSAVGLDALGLGSDLAGFGADGAGLGFDGYGLSLDFQGLALDYEGAGSILGAEGVPGFPAVGGAGGVEGLGPLGGLGAAPSAGLGQASSLGTLSVPPAWSEAVSSVAPLPVDANAMPGGYGAVSAPSTGISKLPLGGMVGREADGAVQRIGFRSSLIPRSPVAG